MATSAALLAGTVCLAPGCSNGTGDAGTTVVATTGVIADVVARVAGPEAEVVQLIPDGTDPHSFALSAEDRLELEQADLVVGNGAGLEAGLPLDETDAPVWELAENVESPLPSSGDEEGAQDPHVWMDPTRVAGAMPSLGDALAEADPDSAEDHLKRADRYARHLLEIDRLVERAMRTIPVSDRELVTSHDSLAYFADRYDFEVLETPFPSTGAEAEASADRLAAVEEAVRDTGVSAIFAQEGDDPEVMELIADDTGAALVYGLLVESPAAAGSYEEMLQVDAELVAGGLAPQGG